MDMAIITFLNIGTSALVFWLAARWYLIPRLKQMTRHEALQPLLLFHGMRHIGLIFLAPTIVSTELASQFAIPAAFGDLAAAILAFIALAAIRKSSQFSIPMVWVFNIFGTIDLLAALSLGLAHSATSFMGAAYYIPAIAVPALLVTHFVMFQLLIRPDSNPVKAMS